MHILEKKKRPKLSDLWKLYKKNSKSNLKNIPIEENSKEQKLIKY